MKEHIEAIKAILTNPDAAPFEKTYAIGLLAIAALAGVLTEQDTKEAQAVVQGFWQGMVVGR